MKVLRRLSLLAVSGFIIGCVLGCPSQTTLAALVNELGTSAAAIAQLEGNQQLATQLQKDTAVASTAIQNWKPGTNGQMAVEAINIVIDDLNLICGQAPQCGQYGPLITLALGTAENIITILESQGAVQGGITARSAKPHTTVHLTAPPQDVKTYKANWNALRASSTTLQKAPVLH